MAFKPDLCDPRYLDEVGWFLNRESECDAYDGSYDEERRADSRSLLHEVLRYCERDVDWIRDKTVISAGCGCTGDLATWPAAIKVAIDPLLNVYRNFGMLLEG